MADRKINNPEVMETVSGDETGFKVDDAFLEDVESRIGMAAGAWDMVNPKDLCADVIAAFLTRYKVRKQ